VWMAALGVLMTIEKLSSTARFSRITGAAFVAVGVTMMAWSFV
jgi:predicted metal-binding membrane protein